MKYISFNARGIARTRRMCVALSALITLTLFGTAHAVTSEGGFSACAHYFHENTPPEIASAAVPGARRALCFTEFAVLHSGATRTPVFVAQRLDPTILTPPAPARTDRFYEEARLPTRERGALAAYVHSGFDRGHLAPAADMRTPEGMAQSFSLANIVPQAPIHNRKAWKKIEQDIRKYVIRSGGAVHVITGAHFDQDDARIGTKTGKWVKVPSALYKLVIDPSRNKAWAHWLENKDDAKIGAPISIEELSRRTGIRF